MLGLALLLALTQTPQHRLFRQPNLPRSSLAFFEFAPQSGTGMGAACACTTPTGAKGETLTFTRASSGTCLKGNTTTGIANGDMVTCSSNQPRVMPGGDGSGGLGLLVEGARTNSVLRSQEFDNAAWTKVFDSAPRTPTITADQAIAPDGTLTADRAQFVATTGAQFSAIQQAGCPNATDSASLFIKGNGTSGTLTLETFNPAQCVSCSYNPNTWTRCVNENKAVGASALIIIGNDSTDCGNSPGAQDVFIWGAQCETGAFASSYVATVGSTVARAAETASITLPVAMNASVGSNAVTFVPEWGASASASTTPYLLYYDASGRALYGNTGDKINIFDGTNDNTRATTYVANTAGRYWSSYTGSTAKVSDSTNTTIASFDGTFGAGALTSLSICNGGGQTAFGVCKQVCADPSEPRCR